MKESQHNHRMNESEKSRLAAEESMRTKTAARRKSSWADIDEEEDGSEALPTIPALSSNKKEMTETSNSAGSSGSGKDKGQGQEKGRKGRKGRSSKESCWSEC